MSNFGFSKFKEIIYIYRETRVKADELFRSVHADAFSLANEFGVEEKSSRSFKQQVYRNNIYSETVNKYWQRPMYLPSVDTGFSKIKTRSAKN